jgi:hypothetical protein
MLHKVIDKQQVHWKQVYLHIILEYSHARHDMNKCAIQSVLHPIFSCGLPNEVLDFYRYHTQYAA